MVFWTFLTYAKCQFLLRQSSSMSGISEEASDGSFNFDFGNQFWNWHMVSWKWWHFFCCWLSTPFPCQSVCGQYSTPKCRFWLQIFVQHLSVGGIESCAGWRLIHRPVSLWLMRPIASPRHCIDSAEWAGHWPSSHRASNLLLVCLFPAENLHHQLCSKIINFYLSLFFSFLLNLLGWHWLFPFTLHWDFTVRMKSGQTDVLYLAQSIGPISMWAFQRQLILLSLTAWF